uniref:Chromosome 1 open reading frame 159 n=3 Tax=Nothobranchius TaxID=28779 RepID=A0A1A8R414_9TELE
MWDYLSDWASKGLSMGLSFLLVLAATVILIRPETPVTKALHQNSLECCGEKHKVNSSCSNNTHCEPGCFFRILENNNTVCIFCDSAAVDLDNVTVCTYNYTVERKNHTTVTTVIPKIGGPGVAASLLLGTLLISLFLILTVASFFYLKRSNRLPSFFYRRNKGFIFQPSETAVMIPSSSVRKPRYVRRERSSAASTLNRATIPTSATTQVYSA